MAQTRTTGIIFPIELVNGKPPLTDGVNLIKSSIKIILSWQLYNREYIDDFGSRVHEVLEDQNDDILFTLIKKFIVDSISLWETRIELKKIVFERPDNTRLNVHLTYWIKDEQIDDTFNYTFFTN